MEDFSSKKAMESSGWEFKGDDYLFRPDERLKLFCEDVPLNSYCGSRISGDGVISFPFYTSGRGVLSYGQSWQSGSVHVYLNDEEIQSINFTDTSSVSFNFSSGDVIRLKESSTYINIHALCYSPTHDSIGMSSNYYMILFVSSVFYKIMLKNSKCI